MDLKSKTRRYVTNVKVTPSLAEELLRNNYGMQRPLKQSKIIKFVEMIQTGRWVCAGEVLKFAKDGTLIDGQNRLHAVVKANSPVLVDLCLGVEKEHFKYLDSGANRSGGDTFYSMKTKNYNSISAAIDLCIRYLGGISKNTIRTDSVENWQRVAFYEENPEISESVKFCVKHRDALRIFGGTSYFAGHHFLFSKFDKDMADQFIYAIAYGNGLRPGDAVILLRNRLLKDKTSKQKISGKDRKALIVLTWNAYVTNTETRHLSWRPNGKGEYKFPRIRGI